MVYRITAEPGYLRADLSGCETGEEMRSFLEAVVHENARHRRSQVLILIHSSTPIFQVESHRLVECLAAIAVTASHRITLVGDTKDLQISHEYIELLARQRGLHVRSFSDELMALRWLRDSRETRDRRVRRERRSGRQRRLHPVERLRQEQRLPVERRREADRRVRRRRADTSLH